jgi:hypothetical protein
MPRGPEGVEGPPIAEEEPLHGVAPIPHEGEPVDDLDGLRRPLPKALGIEATPIAADDLTRGMRLEPRRDRGGRAFGEQIHHLVALEITANGPDAPAPPPGPFIKADHPGGRHEGTRHAMDDTPDRPATSREAPRVCEPRASTTTHREAHAASGRTHADTMTATEGDEARKPLGENAPWTRRPSAEEATPLQRQEHLSPSDGQVGDRASGGTMPRGGAVLTTRTRG